MARRKSAKDRLESELERQAMDYAVARGWFEVKLETCSKDGMPDRFLARKPEGVILIEMKREVGGELSGAQVRRHKELRNHGVTGSVIDSLEEAKSVLF